MSEIDPLIKREMQWMALGVLENRDLAPIIIARVRRRRIRNALISLVAIFAISGVSIGAYEFLSKKSPISFKTKNSVDDIFENMFSKIFGDQKTKNNSSKVRIRISLEEAYLGCEKEVEVDKHEFCNNCEGTGGSLWEPCVKCNGGFVYENRLPRAACYFCEGKGSIIKEKCQSCSGNGFIIKEKKSLLVRVPSGIQNDTQIRLAGEGSGGGDLRQEPRGQSQGGGGGSACSQPWGGVSGAGVCRRYAGVDGGGGSTHQQTWGNDLGGSDGVSLAHGYL